MKTFACCLTLMLLGSALAAGPLKTEDGFEVPQPGRIFEFPRDHGSHPTFKIEWWYLTGHLRDQDGGTFGFQATFFRRAYRETDGAPPKHIHLAHMALTDIRGDRFFHQEHLARSDWDAFAAEERLSVRNGPWTLEHQHVGGKDAFVVAGGIQAQVFFELTLRPTKPLVVFGEDGVSRKGSDPTAASHYLTFPRMSVTGTLKLPDTKEAKVVQGEAWMDHEFSSSQLSQGQVGWDWAGIQLDDGREVMVYRLRLDTGATDPASRLTWIGRDGRTVTTAFTWRVESEWKSASSGVGYPSVVCIDTIDPESGRGITLKLTPVRADQELIGQRGGVTYWEGACLVEIPSTGISGRAYMELTGYAGQLKM